MTIPDLIARVESAPPEMERVLLEEGARHILPEPTPLDYSDWLDGHFTDTHRLWDNFLAKLDAGAGLCAAMMLVPEKYKDDWLLAGGAAYFGYDSMYWSEGKADFTGYASTPALALLAARLKQEMG